ncbi:cytochrome P450 [Apiospora hydei]|uniref:Cytochrome P450 n=1 Tax=Apiospora hydei TaxID=1337664 RepID=A0ABR1VHN3_9PEZI
MTLLDALATQGSLTKPANMMGAVTISLILYVVSTIIYRLWFHPLAKVPGPKYMALWDVPSQWRSFITMDMVRHATVLHRQYGPLVRIGPDRLAIEGSVSWPEVYGVRSSRADNEYSKVPGLAFPNDHMALLGAGRDDHRRQRRQMGHAFSSSALHEQEAIITRYVDKFMDAITARARAGEALNLVDWLNFTTFDIIGDLAFADTFRSLDGDTTFVKNIFRGVVGGAYRRFWVQFPMLKNFRLGRVKGQARMAMGAEPKDGRRDFATYMLRKGKDGESVLSDAEVQALSSVLVIAGSETTATALSGFTFFIGTHAEKRRVLEEEIRNSFADEAEITMTSTGHLEYLNAVIEEMLRLYPRRRRSRHELVFQHATNRNPDSFADPDSFEPERWLGPNHARYNPRYAGDKREVVKPFSTGPRDCIGKNLAYAEMRVIICRLLYRFEIELLPGQERWMDDQKAAFVWVKGPLVVRLKPHVGAVLD